MGGNSIHQVSAKRHRSGCQSLKDEPHTLPDSGFGKKLEALLLLAEGFWVVEVAKVL
jgi:hypothetical protein